MNTKTLITVVLVFIIAMTSTCIIAPAITPFFGFAITLACIFTLVDYIFKSIDSYFKDKGNGKGPKIQSGSAAA